MPSLVRRRLACVVIAVLLQSAAYGQDTARAKPKPPAEPNAPHERMTFFEGTWSLVPVKGEPAITHEETCAWMAGGRRHMVCRNWRERDGVRSDAMYIMSYREEEDSYIVHHAFAGGAAVTYLGKFDGERWLLDMVSAPGLPKTHRFREIITAVPEGIRYVEERSIDGGPWEVTEDFRHRRVK